MIRPSESSKIIKNEIEKQLKINSMKKTWLIDAGHGGWNPDTGYTTAPAKMHKFDDFTIYEGLINRGIAHKLMSMLSNVGVKYEQIHHMVDDTPLATRVKKANNFHHKHGNCVYLSIHSNASETHTASGFEVFTSKGNTDSDFIGDIFCKMYQFYFPEYKFRKDTSDGDDDKEADFYVLAKTNCPAVLVENLFFDEINQAKYLLTKEGQHKIAYCLFNAIMKVEQSNKV